MKRLFLIFTFILLIVTPGISQTYTVESVPNVKLVNNSYVSNPDNIITEATVAAIDNALRVLEDSSTAQVAVVLLASIGEADHVDFAQELFDKWKIGMSGKENGLLILLVKDQRTIRFHTGYGIEGVLPDAVCKQIQREAMVPYFKDDNYDQAMLEGVQAVAARLSNPEEFVEANTNDENLPLSFFTYWIIGAWFLVAFISLIVKFVKKSFSKVDDNSPVVRFSAFGWTTWFLIVPVLLMFVLTMSDNVLLFLGGMYAYFGLNFLVKRQKIEDEASRWLEKKEFHALYHFYQKHLGTFSALRFFIPVPFAFMYRSFKNKMDFFRNHPRDCHQCGKPLQKLNEQADDQFLSKAELMEEGLKSIDYDIWRCSACNAADKLSYVNAKSKYETCPKCSARTYYLQSDKVIRAATTSSTGLGEKIHICKYCKNRNVDRYTIAKVESSSSSSSGGSSGGSWGGGSSGGGGASSSW
ncbi:MAG TPA: TPM domain-containing protein [Chryseosolibacter sp.]|nr:TPM domain-containing protein [Chryseosolibacter sp.]